jgi:hypothetical protein
MLHPDLARALATAHIEDLHRAAARRQSIRLAGRVAHERHVAATAKAILRSASTRLRGCHVPQADGTLEAGPDETGFVDPYCDGSAVSESEIS